MNQSINKFFLALSLAALPGLALAVQKDPPKKAATKSQSRSKKKKAAPKAAPAKAPALESASPSPTPVAEAPAPKPIVTEISASDLEKYGLSLEFNGESVRVTGTLSRACAERLSIKDIKKQSPETSEDGFSSATDLNRHASKVGVRLSFNGDECLNSLIDCEEQNKGSSNKMDLSFRPELSKPILEKGEVALVGLLNEKNEVVSLKSESLSYRRLKQQLEDKDCKNCNSDSKSVKKRLEQLASLDLPWVQPLMKTLIDAAVSEQEAAIKNAKNLSELDAALRDLSDYAKVADRLNLGSAEKAALMAQISKDMDLMLERNQSLAYDSKSKCGEKQIGRSFYQSGSTCDTESAHADFIAKTYTEIAQLPGIDRDSSAEAKRIARDYSAGGAARIDFLSNVNPANEEVRAVLNGGGRTLQMLSNDVRRSCSWVFNERQFVRCNQAKQAYSSNLNQLNVLAQRFMDAQRMNQAQLQNTQYGPGAYSGFGATSPYGNTAQFGHAQNASPNNTQAPAIPVNGNIGQIPNAGAPGYNGFQYPTHG